MKIVVSSDEYFSLIDVLLQEVRKQGHEVDYVGPGQGEKSIDWPVVTLKAMEAIQEGKADEAIVLCWTGTGCSIIANKIPGIRERAGAELKVDVGGCVERDFESMV
jgi:ribose 5-phosphate isomerase RpiB